MADLNISLILKLVDQATAPARAAMRNVEGLGKKAQQIGREGIENARRAEENSKLRRGQLRGETMALGGMGLALYGLLRPSILFEQQMSKVGAISRAGADDLDLMTATARELGATTPWTARQAAEGMQYLAMAGFEVNETIAAMPGLLQLATAAGADLGRTSDIVSDMLSGFGMDADEMGRLGDVLTKTFTTSNTTLEMLGETMSYVAPAARGAGVSIEQAAAMAGLLANEGIKGSRAGTALNAILNKLAAPSKEAADAMEQYGIVVKDANGNFRDVPTIMAEMQKATEDMGEVGRSEFLSTIFGLEAANAASTLLEQAGAGSMHKYAESLKEVGVAARVAAQMSDNTTGALKRLGSAAEGVMLSFGDALIPMLADMVEKLIPIVEQTMRWVDANPQLVVTLAKVVGALFAMKAAGLAVRWAFEALFLGFIKFDKLLSYIVLIGGWLLRIVAVVGGTTAGIVGLVAAAVAAVAYMIYDNWDRITAYVTAKIDRIRAAFDDGILNGVMTTLSELNPFEIMIDVMSGQLDWVVEKMRGLADLIGAIDLFDAGVAMIQSLGRGMMSLLDGIVSSIAAKLDKIMPAWMKSAWNWAQDGLALGPSSSSAAQSPGRALGGPVRAGLIYRWMEEGTELFQPQVDGNVVSTRQMRAMATGGGRGAGQTVSIGDVHVHASPGMSVEDVGREVMRVLRRQAEAAGAVLHDGGAHA